jgi:pimeloyl-ACP methyl ester carboxylesterase
MVEEAVTYAPPRPRDPSRGGAGLLTMDPDAFVEFARELSDYPSFLAQLAALRCPTTVVVGEHDRALLLGCKRIAETIPGARLVTMASCGHSPQEDDPETFVRLVREHLG